MPGSRIVLSTTPGATVRLRCGATTLFEGKVIKIDPQAVARFISKGFSRGAAPDNLVFLPLAKNGGAGSAPRGADVCPACGDLALVRKGKSLICQTCGERAPQVG